MHIVSAWCSEKGISFGQEKVYEKSNEITAIPELLKRIDVKNRIITIDAMGAQRNICRQIINQEGDYLISLKGNQGNLRKDVEEFLKNTEFCLMHEENDKGHGRIEKRLAFASSDIAWLQEFHNWL